MSETTRAEQKRQIGSAHYLWLGIERGARVMRPPLAAISGREVTGKVVPIP
jgi:hypothetical protein